MLTGTFGCNDREHTIVSQFRANKIIAVLQVTQLDLAKGSSHAEFCFAFQN